MKAVSDRLPDGITLSSWNYRLSIGLNISGEAPLDGSELDFKELMENLSFEGESEGNAKKVFSGVHMGGTRESKGMRHFNMELSLVPKEEE
jgi:hypothetical protein